MSLENLPNWNLSKQLTKVWKNIWKQIWQAFDTKPKDIFWLPITNFFGTEEKKLILQNIKDNEYHSNQIKQIFSELKKVFHNLKNSRKYLWIQMKIVAKDFKDILIVLMAKVEWISKETFEILDKEVKQLEKDYKIV